MGCLWGAYEVAMECPWGVVGIVGIAPPRQTSKMGGEVYHRPARPTRKYDTSRAMVDGVMCAPYDPPH